MMGGKVRDRIRAYAWIGGDRPHEIGDAARARREQGFSAIKMNATGELDWLGAPRLLVDVVKRVEAAQAEGMDVGLDFHGRVHKPMAKQLAKLLEPLGRSEEHTSELQSLMRISYAVFCLKKKNKQKNTTLKTPLKKPQ